MVRSPRKALSLILSIAIVSSSAYWVLQFASPSKPVEPLVAIPATDRSARTQSMNVAPIAALFGSGDDSTASSSITVAGVIAQGGKNEGIALLSVDNRPAMAFRAGETVTGDLMLKRVNADGGTVERNGVTREILLPARQPPSGIDPVR